MRVATSGGGGGTIVVDIAGVRAAAATLADAANAYHVLASRVRGHALPEMPPGVSGSVAASIQEAASTIASGAPRLLALAQDLRVRAFWAEAADRLMAGADLEGPLLDEFTAGMASGLLTKYSEPWQAELARSYAKELYDRAHPGGIAGFFHDVGGGIGDFFSGAWDAVKDPAVMLYHLTPLHSGWTDEWSQLGHGLSYGVTHPGEFGKALIGLDMLEDEGFAYWLGNLAPAVAATVMSGGAGAAVRGADGVAAVDRAAVGIEDASRLARVAEVGTRAKPEWLRRLELGNEFNVERRPFYEFKEVYVEKPGGGYYRVDSYDTIKEEIVSRKYTQLGEVQEKSAARYLQEIDEKYAPGTPIGDVPSTHDVLRGKRLDGMKVLEVPPQRGPLPQSIIDLADDLDIVIRDTNGHVYNP